MSWEQIEPDFEPDGSLRDIYVAATGFLDWQRVLDGLRAWRPIPTLTIDGEVADFPDKVESLFGKRSALLSVNASGAWINCHFFGADEIEFDLDPREVTGSSQLERVRQFIHLLGDVTGKPVAVTLENIREAVISRYVPQDQT